MKNVLISIQPKWCDLIAKGEKTVEVRKTKPNRPMPIRCYIYETQGKTEEPWMDEDGHMIFRGRGMVIGEFECRDILDFSLDPYGHHEYFISDDDLEASCLTDEELWDYGKGKTLYGWQISDLVIYDNPKELGEFEKPWCDSNGKWHDIRPCECGKYCKHEYFDYSENTLACGIDFDGDNCPYTRITRPPQSWCYVEV